MSAVSTEDTFLFGVPIYLRKHMLSFLGPQGSMDQRAVACCTRRLSWESQSRFGSGEEGWTFTSGLLLRGRLKWGCWDTPKREVAFLHTAIHRYCDFMTRDGAPIKEEAAIPRIIHMIWLGSSPPPYVEALRDSWKRHHPDWEHWLWTDADLGRLPEGGLRNSEAFAAASNYGEKSDILRYEILYQLGGLYVDCDFECLSPMDDLHTWPGLGLYTGLSNTGTVEVNNGLIGSRPGHPLLAAMIQDIHHHQEQGKAASKQSPPPPPSARLSEMGLSLIMSGGGSGGCTTSSGASLGGLMSSFLGGAEATALENVMTKVKEERAMMGTIERTGPGLFTRKIFMSMPLPKSPPHDESSCLEASGHDILVLPPTWFYAVPNNVGGGRGGVQLGSGGGDSEGSDESMARLKARYVRPLVSRAVHYWARSWQQQAS